jgi:hypothetical protein
MQTESTFVGTRVVPNTVGIIVQQLYGDLGWTIHLHVVQSRLDRLAVEMRFTCPASAALRHAVES